MGYDGRVYCQIQKLSQARMCQARSVGEFRIPEGGRFRRLIRRQNVVATLPSQVLAAAWLLLLTSIRWWVVNAVGGIWLESSNAPNHQRVFQQYNSRRQQVQMASVAAAIIPPVVWVVDHMFRTLSKTSASP